MTRWRHFLRAIGFQDRTWDATDEKASGGAILRAVAASVSRDLPKPIPRCPECLTSFVRHLRPGETVLPLCHRCEKLIAEKKSAERVGVTEFRRRPKGA